MSKAEIFHFSFPFFSGGSRGNHRLESGLVRLPGPGHKCPI